MLGTELMRKAAQKRIQALGLGSPGLKQLHQPRAVLSNLDKLLNFYAPSVFNKFLLSAYYVPMTFLDT